MRAVAVVMMLMMTSWAVVGCGSDLGQCDLPRAQKMVYLNGIPYTEGQALMHQSCAGGLCHAQSATGDSRVGAPHGLDFDVVPMNKSSTPANLAVLQKGVSTIRDEAAEIWSEVDDGTMPPGEAGDRPDLPWKLDKEGTTDAMLTGVDLDGARDTLRNWLACAAPIIAATTDSPLRDAAAPLGASAEPGESTIEATLPSIFEKLLVQQCQVCHKAGGVFPSIDFTSVDTSFDTLVGKDAAAAGACGGRKLVVPNDCQNSLLWQKIQPMGTVPLCGTTMPQGGDVPDEMTRNAVCDWINAGALK